MAENISQSFCSLSRPAAERIRRYKKEDRELIRKICADTAVMGESIDLFFSNSKFFVDFFTSYYTDVEPQSAFVVECDRKVVGYLLGCTDIKKYMLYQFIIFCNLILKILRGIF